MLNCTLMQKHIQIIIVLKNPSGVPTFDDLLNFVNAVTVNVVTHYVATTLTNMTFSYISWKHERWKLHFYNACFNRYVSIIVFFFSQKHSNTIDRHSNSITTMTSTVTKVLSVFVDLLYMKMRNENHDVVLVFEKITR